MPGSVTSKCWCYSWINDCEDEDRGWEEGRGKRCTPICRIGVHQGTQGPAAGDWDSLFWRLNWKVLPLRYVTVSWGTKRRLMPLVGPNDLSEALSNWRKKCRGHWRDVQNIQIHHDGVRAQRSPHAERDQACHISRGPRWNFGVRADIGGELIVHCPGRIKLSGFD